MSFEAVKGRELTAEVPSAEMLRAEGLAQPTRYDLATALRVVRTVETSPGRGAVFEEIKKKNWLYRLVDGIYEAAGPRLLQPLFLWVYMVKCVLSVGPFKGIEADAVALANFPNEHATADRIAALVPDTRIHRLTIGREHAFGLWQVSAAFKMLGAANRVLPFLARLTRTHSFMPAARITSTLAFYMQFSWFYAGRSDLKAAIITSNYSPEAVGLAAAAHQANRRVIYANHAPIPANGEVVPPVFADLALLYGNQTAKTYRRRSAITSDVALIGQPGQTRAMDWRDELTQVGIFLTSGTRTDTLAALIASIRRSHPGVHILIRDHPVALLRNDLSEIVVDDPKVTLTIGNPLDEEIAACDLIICGNSGVALNALCGGRPVACLTALDGILFDFNGFIESGLVCPIEGWSVDLYASLQRFYQAPEWQAIMQDFDASYGVDETALKREASAALIAHIDTEKMA